VSESKHSLTIKRPHLIGELLIVIVLIKVYDYVRSLAEVRGGPALKHGREVLSIERVLRLNFESVGNRWLADHDVVSLVAAYWYQFAHISVTLAVLAWCYIGSPTIYRRARNALVATNLVGMTVYFFLPVMPPRLLPGASFIDSVAEAGFRSDHDGPVQADQYAAMPSLHLAWAVWTSLVAVALLRRYRGHLLCYLYPAITAAVVVVTANHYVLDVVAGVAVAFATTWVTGLLRPGEPALVSIRRPSLGWRSLPGGSSLVRALGWIRLDDPAAEQYREYTCPRQQRHPDREQSIPQDRAERDGRGHSHCGEGRHQSYVQGPDATRRGDDGGQRGHHHVDRDGGPHGDGASDAPQHRVQDHAVQQGDRQGPQPERRRPGRVAHHGA
jgi:membrane-associated phospholipid phosphatase